MRRAVFLDRDGVINRNVYNPATAAYESPHKPDDFELLPGVLTAIQRLRDAGYSLFLVSNQPSYAKGKTSLAALEAIHGRLLEQLAAAGIAFSDFYYCFHHPKGVVPDYSGHCECRKPSPYFLFQAEKKFGLSLAGSWMVGDRATDIECGRAAGVRTIRVAPDHPTSDVDTGIAPDFMARDLAHGVEIILTADDGKRKP